MAQVKARENESIESLLRRFKKAVESEGIIKEYKEKRYFQKPSAKRRAKEKEAARRMKTQKPKKENFGR